MKANIFVFPHETLTPIVGKPTHDAIKKLRNQVYANAMNNECTLGGGDYGYLGLIMPTEEYLQLQRDEGNNNPIEFIKPPLPDPAAAPADIKRASQKILDVKSMEAHLQRQILAAIDEKIIETLVADV